MLSLWKLSLAIIDVAIKYKTKSRVAVITVAMVTKNHSRYSASIASLFSAIFCNHLRTSPAWPYIYYFFCTYPGNIPYHKIRV